MLYLQASYHYLSYFWTSLITWLTTNVGLITVVAIMLAPIFTLRVQKKLEARKEKEQRKLFIFKTLVATYATRVSPDHIQALNMINIEFYGIEHVLNSWHLYQNHLTTAVADANNTSIPLEERELKAKEWIDRGSDLFIDLLVCMSKEVGYPFDKTTLSNGIYYPIAHQRLEDENRFLRQGLLDIIYNNKPISMNVLSLPMNQDVLDKQNKLQDSLIDYYDGKKSVKVTMENKKD